MLEMDDLNRFVDLASSMMPPSNRGPGVDTPSGYLTSVWSADHHRLILRGAAIDQCILRSCYNAEQPRMADSRRGSSA